MPRGGLRRLCQQAIQPTPAPGEGSGVLALAPPFTSVTSANGMVRPCSRPSSKQSWRGGSEDKEHAMSEKLTSALARIADLFDPHLLFRDVTRTDIAPTCPLATLASGAR